MQTRQAEARDAPIARFHPDDATERRGLADRAAGIAAERAEGFIGRDRRRRSATRAPATRDKSQGLRVVLTLEFSVEEPIANSSRFVLPNGIAPAAEACELPRRRRSSDSRAGCVEAQVQGCPATLMLSLIAIGTPPSGRFTSAFAASSKAALKIERQVSADAIIHFGDASVQRLHDLPRRDLAFPEQSLKLGDGLRRQIARTHSTTFVTTKSPFACRGAFATLPLR